MLEHGAGSPGRKAAVAVLAIGMFFMLIGAILICVTGFMDIEDADDLEDVATMGTVGVMLILIGLLALTGGFAYAGAVTSEGTAKIGWFIFAGLALYLFMKLISAAAGSLSSLSKALA